MPRGGERVGSGRKPRQAAILRLHGSRWKKPNQPAPKAPQGRVMAVELPAGLSVAAQTVWQEWAPHATQALTLTPATVLDFAGLCELVVEMREVLEKRRGEGWTDLGLRLAREYRGLVQRVETTLRAFRLAPIGKEMVTAEVDEDPFAEFDGKEQVQ